jgi:hypothetical protein
LNHEADFLRPISERNKQIVLILAVVIDFRGQAKDAALAKIRNAPAPGGMRRHVP